MRAKFAVFVLSVVFMVMAGYQAALAAQPTLARLQTLLAMPLGEDPEHNESFGTTLEPAIATDIAAGLKIDGTVQQFTVINEDTSGTICIGSVAWSGADSCATRCAETTAWSSQDRYDALMNCTAGDDSRGSAVPPGQSRPFRYDGTKCVCAVASEANTAGQIERVVY